MFFPIGESCSLVLFSWDKSRGWGHVARLLLRYHFEPCLSARVNSSALGYLWTLLWESRFVADRVCRRLAVRCPFLLSHLHRIRYERLIVSLCSCSSVDLLGDIRLTRFIEGISVRLWPLLVEALLRRVAGCCFGSQTLGSLVSPLASLFPTQALSSHPIRCYL